MYFGDAAFRDVDVEFEQFAMDPRRTPKGILPAHLADQISHLARNDRSGRPRRTFAGGRRLAALLLLADGGKIDASYAVPCQVLGNGVDAAEIILSENTLPEAMHTADELEAFRALVDAGTSEDPRELIPAKAIHPQFACDENRHKTGSKKLHERDLGRDFEGAKVNLNEYLD